MKKRIYVSNIPFSATKEDLAEYFSDYGAIAHCTIILNRDTQESRGFGFVEFQDPKDADDALNADESRFQGRKIRVGWANDRPERQEHATEHRRSKW